MSERITLTRQGHFETSSTNACLEPEKHGSEDPDVDCLHGPVSDVVDDVNTIMRWWHNNIYLEEGATFGDLLRALRHIPNIHIIDELCRTNFQRVFDQVDNPTTDTDDTLNIRQIRLYWNPEIQRWSERGDKGYIWDRPECDGWGDYLPGSYPDWLEDPPTEGGIGIEFTHMSQLLHLPIFLKEEYEVFYDSHDFGLPLGVVRYAVKTNRSFSLGDLLYGIFFELEV